jgi:hypothetical protein
MKCRPDGADRPRRSSGASPNPQFAPSHLPRRSRRRLDRQFQKLVCAEVCSCCRAAIAHNARVTAGLDAHGNAVLAGECCTGRVHQIFAQGLSLHRTYDFLPAPSSSPRSCEASGEELARMLAACRRLVAHADERIGNAERLGGVQHLSDATVLDSPWKTDDARWFKEHPQRAHRLRPPLPGEIDGTALADLAKARAGSVVIMVIRQVEPGSRMRGGLCLDVRMLVPDAGSGMPDDESFAHALFDLAVEREAAPTTVEEFCLLVEKYAANLRGQ